MDQKIENPDKKKSKKKRIILWVFLLLFLLGFLLLGISFWGDEKLNENGESQENSENLDVSNEVEKDDEDTLEINSKNEVGSDEGDQELVSENYKVTQVKFGGNVVIENGKSRDTKLEIYQVKSENIISQEDEEPRILISWKTNKEAISTVSYAKSDGAGSANVSEGGYGFDHMMLLKNMEFSTIYTYKIQVRDKWGNKADTEYFSAYTGDESESIFDLITNAVEDVFGWAMK